MKYVFALCAGFLVLGGTAFANEAQDACLTYTAAHSGGADADKCQCIADKSTGNAEAIGKMASIVTPDDLQAVKDGGGDAADIINACFPDGV